MKIENQIPVRLSKWVHEFRRKGCAHVALFHSLDLETIYLEERFSGVIDMLKIGTTKDHLIKTCPSGPFVEELAQIVDSLHEANMVVPVQSDDTQQLASKRDEHVTQCGLETMYLLVTDECNLRCRYCFMNKGMPEAYVRNTMSWDVAKKAIDMFFANIKRNPPVYDEIIKSIIFYGGEPFLNFPVIRKVVEYVETTYAQELEQMGEAFVFSAVSNGTRITEEVALFLRDHPKFALALSIDGPREVHDSQRVTVGQTGSYAEVMRGYELLTTVGGRKDISVSCTIGEHNIDRLDELLAMQKQFGFAGVSMNSMLDTGTDPVTRAYMVKVSRNMIEYFIKARDQGVYEDRIMRKVRAFIEKRVHAFDCQATGSQVVCSPDGKLGVCHEGLGMKNFFFDQVSPQFRFHDNPVIMEWKKRTPLNMPQCWSCPALGMCGGGCAYGAWLRNGSIWSVDDRFCIHSLATLEWIIWDLYSRV